MWTIIKVALFCAIFFNNHEKYENNNNNYYYLKLVYKNK